MWTLEQWATNNTSGVQFRLIGIYASNRERALHWLRKQNSHLVTILPWKMYARDGGTMDLRVGFVVASRKGRSKIWIPKFRQMMPEALITRLSKEVLPQVFGLRLHGHEGDDDDDDDNEMDEHGNVDGGNSTTGGGGGYDDDEMNSFA